MNTFQKMSFRVSSLLVLTFVFVSLISCKKDSDEPTPSEIGLEGSWQITAITVTPPQSGITDFLAFYNGFAGNQCLSTIKFTFKVGGKIETTIPAGCESAKAAAETQLGLNDNTTWKVNGDKLTLTSTTTNEYTIKVDGSTMNLTNTTVDSNGTTYTYLFVFKRV